MPMLDPFDIAPHARRHTLAAWCMLVASIVFASGCAFLLRGALQDRVAVEADAGRAQLAQREQAKELAAQQALRTPAALARARAQQRLHAMLRLSWTSLFDVLEAAGQEVEGRATIVALAPVRPRANAAEVSITGVAVSHHVMLEYVKALQRHPQVRDVEISMHQWATRGTGTARVVRFQLSMLWDPATAVAIQRGRSE